MPNSTQDAGNSGENASTPQNRWLRFLGKSGAHCSWIARTCGRTLARAHARSGDPVAIAAYLGEADAFDKSITDFSERYADQNERDYTEFVNAIKSGRLKAVEGV